MTTEHKPHSEQVDELKTIIWQRVLETEDAKRALELIDELVEQMEKPAREDATIAERVARLEEMHGGMIRAHDGRVVA